MVRIPAFRGRSTSAGPAFSSLDPLGSPVFHTDSAVIVVHAKLKPAGRADFIRATAVARAGRFFEVGKSADGARMGRVHGALRFTGVPG